MKAMAQNKKSSEEERFNEKAVGNLDLNALSMMGTSPNAMKIAQTLNMTKLKAADISNLLKKINNGRSVDYSFFHRFP